MDTFFAFLKQGIVAIMFLIFGFIAVYTPQPLNKVETADAAFATVLNQLKDDILQTYNTIEIAGINISATLSAAYDAVTSFATKMLELKEFTLDGIAWAVAKAAISSMVQSLINWINTGFKGSPAFVQDLLGTLLERADNVAGQYIKDLGAIGSFICSSFQLDIQLALSLTYQQQRVHESSSCSLSGVINNIDDFLSGTQGSFSEGGWEDWLTISAAPEKYTPYGSFLSAKAGMDATIENARGEKLSIIGFGEGFLSNEICETVNGPSGSRKKCFISTPGKTIQTTLTTYLGSGIGSLIAADEIDEIIGALVGQLAQQAITGAAGLLGLSGGHSRSYEGFGGDSYLEAMDQEAGNQVDTSDILILIQDHLVIQQEFATAAANYQPELRAVTGRFSTQAQRAVVETERVITNSGPNTSNILTLQQLISELSNPTLSSDSKNKIAQTYSTLDLYSLQEMESVTAAWVDILKQDRRLATQDVVSDKIRIISEASSLEQDMHSQALVYQVNLTVRGKNTHIDGKYRRRAKKEAGEAERVAVATQVTIQNLDDLMERLSTTNITSTDIDTIMTEFEDMDLYSQAEITQQVVIWERARYSF